MPQATLPLVDGDLHLSLRTRATKTASDTCLDEPEPGGYISWDHGLQSKPGPLSQGGSRDGGGCQPQGPLTQVHTGSY